MNQEGESQQKEYRLHTPEQNLERNICHSVQDEQCHKNDDKGFNFADLKKEYAKQNYQKDFEYRMGLMDEGSPRKILTNQESALKLHECTIAKG